MLRASARDTDADVDIQAIGGDEVSADQGIEFGSQLMRFAEAVAGRDERSISAARTSLIEVAGHDVMVDAAGVAANFQRMVRIADSIGIPYDAAATRTSKEIQQQLNLRSFTSSQHTPI